MYDLFGMIVEGSISHSIATQKLFPLMLKFPDQAPKDLASSHDLLLDKEEGGLQEVINEVLSAFPDKVKAYQNGKKGLIGLFMGEVMKKTDGKIDPKEANKLLRESLASSVV